jgi:hypothetical protein
MSGVQDDPPSAEDGEFGFIDDFGFAEGHDASSPDPRTWRMAALAAGTCLVAVAAAIVLLRLGGGSSNKEVSLPIVTGGPSSPVVSSIASTPVHPTRHVHVAVRPRRTRTSGARTTSAHLTPPSSPHPTPPPSTRAVRSTPAPPKPTVQLTRGTRDYRCGLNCAFLVVTLTNFAGGHHVSCRTAAGEFQSYDTARPVSYGCSHNGPGQLVWVVVDYRYRSNSVTW